jgi:TRAP-type uncharacterized transport system fused permease subunit
MNSSTLIVTDVVLVLVVVLILATDELRKHGAILIPLIAIACASCIVRHISHYKHTKKLY